MIESFRHKGLQRFFTDEDGKRLPPEMLPRIADILSALNTARRVEEMDRPAFHLHPLRGDLRGDLRGFWAVTVRANWRIIFRFVDGSAHDVDFVDYH